MDKEHVWDPPPDDRATWLEDTAAGTLVWPRRVSPQQFTAPAMDKEHVWKLPADTATWLEDA